MTPISRTSERPTDIVHVQDQAKICFYLGQEIIMSNSVLDFPQPIRDRSLFIGRGGEGGGGGNLRGDLKF